MARAERTLSVTGALDLLRPSRSVQRLARRIVRLLRLALAWARVPHRGWVTTLVDCQLGVDIVRYDTSTQRLWLKPLDIGLAFPADAFVLRRFHHALDLQTLAGFRFDVTGSGLVAKRPEVSMVLEQESDFLILHEIYVQGAYSFSTFDHAVVLDIGMNVAYASLYFASMDNVVAVLGYEPFEPTFRQAQLNLEMNPALSRKVETVNRGVSSRTVRCQTLYDYGNKAHMKVAAVSPEDREDSPLRPAGAEVAVDLEDADAIVRTSRDRFPHCALVAKIDCEGMEYEILERLAETGSLRALSILVIEWHARGPSALIELLRQNGFVTFCRDPRGPEIGLIHAVRVHGEAHGIA